MVKGIKTFRDLVVWQRSHELVLEIYKITKLFPNEEKFGLTSQVRRSASSIATNVVEGYKKNGDKEFLRYLNIADCCLEETKYHLLLAKDLDFLSQKNFDHLLLLCDEIGRMLFNLQKSLST